MKYCLGFLFTDYGIILLHKNSGPSCVVGKLNGIGGKVEENETYLQAMEREGLEEAKSLFNWKFAGNVSGEKYELAVFKAKISGDHPLTHDLPQLIPEGCLDWYSFKYLRDKELAPNVENMVGLMKNDMVFYLTETR